MSTSIIIAEGQTVTRQAVRLLVERAGYSVLAEAADGMSAVQRVLQLRPDIVIIGLQMRRLSGLEAIRRIHRELPDTRVVVLSALDSPHSMSLCAQAGATAFVSKQGELSELISALDAVRRGRSWYPAIVEGSPSSEATQLDALSARERLVLSYLVKGERLRHIAAELALSESTVSTYKRRLLEKLNADSVVELAEIVRRSEADALPASPAPVRAVLDALPFHATVRDGAGRALFVNRYGREALGERAQQLVGTDFVEHAKLLGLPFDRASELEYVFADAVRNGKSYRREMTLDGRNGIVAALHWGAPLYAGNKHDAMLCGSINVTDQEEAFVAVREQLAQAELSAHQKDGLIQHCLQTLSPEVARLAALIAQAPRDGTTAQASAAIDSMRASLNRLTLLARIHDDTGANTPERCTPAALLRAAIDHACLRHTQAKITLEIATPNSAARVAWLDRQAFDDLLALLLDAALGNASTNAPDTRSVNVELKTAARTRGLLDLQVVMDAAPINVKRRARKATREYDAWLLPACEKIARRIGASLNFADDGPRRRITLKAQIPRTQENKNGESR